MSHTEPETTVLAEGAVTSQIPGNRSRPGGQGHMGWLQGGGGWRETQQGWRPTAGLHGASEVLPCSPHTTHSLLETRAGGAGSEKPQCKRQVPRRRGAVTTPSAGTFKSTKRRKQENAPGLSPHLNSGVKHLLSLMTRSRRSVMGTPRPPPSRAGRYEHL